MPKTIMMPIDIENPVTIETLQSMMKKKLMIANKRFCVSINF